MQKRVLAVALCAAFALSSTAYAESPPITSSEAATLSKLMSNKLIGTPQTAAAGLSSESAKNPPKESSGSDYTADYGATDYGAPVDYGAGACVLKAQALNRSFSFSLQGGPEGFTTKCEIKPENGK